MNKSQLSKFKKLFVALSFFLFIFKGPGYFLCAAGSAAESNFARRMAERNENVNEAAGNTVNESSRAVPNEPAIKETADKPSGLNMVFIGDNVTLGTSAITLDFDFPEVSFPAVLQNRMNLTVINSGKRWATSAIYLGLLDEMVFSYDPDAVVINLGLIDFLTKTPPGETGKNLQEIISALNNGKRKIFLARFYDEDILRANMNHMELTLNEQNKLLKEYDDVYRDLSIKNDIVLITGIWEGLEYGINIAGDYINPTAEGHRVMAETFFRFFKPYLEAYNLTK